MSLNRKKFVSIFKDIELDLFVVFFIVMAVYYGYRMFSIAPSYDELYTYSYFISRGPIYAGIHWPVPNNHIGYSALSGIIYVITHNPYLSLRGVSYLCSLGNLIMLFMIGRMLLAAGTDYNFAGTNAGHGSDALHSSAEHFNNPAASGMGNAGYSSRGFSLILPAVYAGAWIVNNITVQGRGYALSTNMMLMALICLLHLCFDEKVKVRYYVLWTFSMILGFYTVMTTLYWVATVCVFAFFVLLSLKQTKRLVRLVISSVIAAFGTVFVYSMVWLAIGSNLLSKDETGAYFGQTHFSIIKSAPVKAVTTGAQYMLDTPYIQSVSREGYLKAFSEHFLDIFNHFYTFGAVLMVICIVSVVLAIVTVISRHRYLRRQAALSNAGELNAVGDRLIAFTWMVISFALVTPAVVFIQCKLPYIRTFSYYAVAAGLCVSYFLYFLFGRLQKIFTYGIGVIVCICAFAYIFSSDYNVPYGDREDAVWTIMKQADLEGYARSGSRICLTDCNQEYMYRFLYDEYPEMCPMEEADIIVLDKDMLDPDAEYHWEFYYDYSTIDQSLLNGMDQLLRNTYYEIYVSHQ